MSIDGNGAAYSTEKHTSANGTRNRSETDYHLLTQIVLIALEVDCYPKLVTNTIMNDEIVRLASKYEYKKKRLLVFDLP